MTYPDGSQQPVRVPRPDWVSARVVGEIAYILLYEVMGYSTILFDTASIFSPHVVNYVAGCLDPDDATCAARDPQNPKVHFTLESWLAGDQRAAALPEDIRPPLLSVSNYNLIDGWYIWRDVLDAGLASPQRLSLDYFRSYDASLGLRPHLFFDPWTRVYEVLPPGLVMRCSDMGPDSAVPRLADRYTRYTGDADVACHYNDTVWFSPACRNDTATCVPLLIQYTFDFAMQMAFWLRLPVAVLLGTPGAAGDFAEYYAAARRGRFLFGWYQPDDSLMDAGGRLPVLVNMPATNDLEYVQGLYRTGTAQYKPRNYAWRGLADADRRGYQRGRGRGREGGGERERERESGIPGTCISTEWQFA